MNSQSRAHGTDFPSVESVSTLSPIVNAYIGGRIRRGEITPITAVGYRNHLRHFAEHWGQRPIRQLSVRAVESYIEQMETEGLAKSTQVAHLSTLRVFAQWMALENLIPKDFTLGAPKVRRPRSMPRDMVADHFFAILNVCRDERERLMCWLMYGCGLRCVEVSRLQVEDYDPLTGLLHVVGKARHERQVPVPDKVRHAMDAYLAVAGHGTGPLIRSYTDPHQPIGANRISNILQRLVRNAGVKVRNYDGRSAHGLRAAAASDIFDVCHDPTVVAEFLGHANLQNVQRYLRRTKLEKVAEAQGARNLDAA